MITEAQRIARLSGIGASDAAAVLGISPYMTPYELWCIKTKRMTGKEILTPEQLRIRNAHEITIADEYSVRNEVNLQVMPDTIYHPEHKFLFCHLDRKVVGQDKFVECKSSISWLAKRFGDEATTEIPPEYLIQMLYTYVITGYTAGDLAVLIDIDTYKQYSVAPNPKLQEHIKEKCIEFWCKYVMTDTPPPLETRNDVLLMFPTVTTSFAEAPPAAIDLFVQLSQAHQDAKKLEAHQDQLKDSFTKHIKGAEGLKLEDKVLCTWKPNAKGTRVLRINYDAGAAA